MSFPSLRKKTHFSLCPFLLVACIQVLLSHANECGTRFIDPVSSTVLSQIVVKGYLNNAVNHAVDHLQRHSVSITIEQIFKGENSLTNMNIGPNDTIVVDRFGPTEDLEACVASMSAVTTAKDHVFFLRPTTSRGLLQMTALPLAADDALTRKITESLCENCIQPPEITKVKCFRCAQAAIVKRLQLKDVRIGRRGRIRCTAYGTPPPTFTWTKDGLPVVSGSGGITVHSTRKTSVLTIRRTTSAHVGEYTCSVQNELGQSSETAALNVTETSRSTGRSTRPNDSANSSRRRGGPGRCYYTNALYCLNGGTCHSSREHSYCQCPDGFEGLACENATIPSEVSSNITFILTNSSDSLIRIPHNIQEDTNATVFEEDKTKPPNTNSEKKNKTSIVNNLTIEIPSNTNGNMENTVNTSTTTQLKPEINEAFFENPTSTTPANASLTEAVASRTKPRQRHPAANKHYSNVDDEARKLIVSRLQNSRLKSSACRKKRYCMNGARCRYVHKLDVQVCLCRDGYFGSRCELKDENVLS